MTLEADQIWIYNQRRNIPTSGGLFVSVHRIGVKPYGNNTKHNGNSVTSSQMMQEVIQIQLFSHDLSAVNRLPEAMAALGSPYSDYVQGRDGFRIGKVPVAVTDLSGLEGAGLLYRTAITVNVLTSYEQVAGATFFDPDTIDFSVDETEA
jgi:hypothetical protein